MTSEGGKKRGLRRLNRAAVENDESDRRFFGRIRTILLKDFVENPDIYTMKGMLFPTSVTFRGEKQPFDWWAPILLFEFGEKILALTWEDGSIVPLTGVKKDGQDIVFPGEGEMADLTIFGAGSTFGRYSSGGEVRELFCYANLSLLYRKELATIMEQFMLMDGEWFKKFSEDGFSGLIE